MNARGTFVARPAPGPFHCLGCATFVTGTPSGHCPRCGWVPPSVLAVPETSPGRRFLPVALAVLAILLVVLLRLV
ncbi:MAG TPA: hypothetical protein VFS15_17225 [Kofleriaceae bacterium]|nr:hypothetical protein [Kofleriaceae bacterium]